MRHDLTIADCKALASTLRRDLIRPLCIFNFGEDKRIPHSRFDCEESEDLTQTAEIIGTLIEKTGLRVPTSYLYKKFSIPEPEADEEIATPRFAGGAGLLPGGQPTTALSLKAGADNGHGTQQRIDQIADAALAASKGNFSRIFGPVRGLVDHAGSLEELKRQLEDDALVEKLLGEMDAGKLEELLQRAMFLADLEGRSIEHGRH